MTLHVGQRVRVKEHYGFIKFIGKTEFAPGEWVGVELDDEVGRNDGSVEGIRYFNLSKQGMYGVFVREKMVNLDEFRGNAPTQQNDISTLHGIIEKLQSKLKHTTGDIRNYRENIRKLEEKLQVSNAKSLNLESILEQISVDKDYLEENNKDLQNSLENIQVKYEELKADFQLLQEELALNKQIEEEVKASLKDRDFSKENISVILERNRQLEHALISLKSLTDQNELNLKNEINILKSNAAISSENNETYSTIAEKLLKAEKKIIHLQEQLDSALESEKIIDSLHAKNEELTQKVEQLNNTIDELTELHELDKNLEESQMLVEKELHKNIKSLKEIIQSDKEVINNLEKTNKFLETKLSDIKSSTKDVESTNNDEILKKEIKELSFNLKNMDMDNLNHKICLKITEQQLLFALNTPLTTNENPNKTIIDMIYNLKKALSSTLSILECLKILKIYNIYPERMYYTMLYKLHHLKVEINFFISLWEWNYENEIFANSLNSFDLACIDINECLGIIQTKFKDGIYDKIDVDFVDSFLDHIYSILKIDHSFIDYSKGIYFNLFYYQYLLDIALVEDEVSRNILNDINNKIMQFFDGKDIFKNFKTKLKDILQKWVTDIDIKLREILQIIKNDIGKDYIPTLKIDLESSFEVKYSLSILDVYYDIESGVTINEEFEENAVQKLLLIEKTIEKHHTLLNIVFTKEKITNIIIYKKNTEVKSNNKNSESKLPNTNELKDEFENLKLKSIEKDRLIDELTINVSLLEKNLGLEHKKNKSYIESIKKELNLISDEKKLVEEQYSSLLNANRVLNLEIQNLIKSSQIFETGHLKKYNDILSEKTYNINLSLIEEILFLKKVIKLNSTKSNSFEELEWLKEPLIPNSETSFNYNSQNFYNLSKNLREISSHASIFNSVCESQQWKSKQTSHRYIIASLDEDISRYKNIKDTILTMSLM